MKGRARARPERGVSVERLTDLAVGPQPAPQFFRHAPHIESRGRDLQRWRLEHGAIPHDIRARHVRHHGGRLRSAFRSKIRNRKVHGVGLAETYRRKDCAVNYSENSRGRSACASRQRRPESFGERKLSAELVGRRQSRGAKDRRAPLDVAARDHMHRLGDRWSGSEDEAKQVLRQVHDAGAGNSKLYRHGQPID